MLVTICDLETTGVNPETDSPIEIGAILYSITKGCTVAQYSTILPVLVNPVEHINKISASVSHLIQPNLEPINNFFSVSSYIVGHNFKGFDKKFFGKGYLPKLTLPIIDTMSDIKFPRVSYHRRNRSLVDIALDHNVAVFKNHRALTDCALIAHIFDCYSEQELLDLFEAGLEPRYTYISLESKTKRMSDEEFEKMKERLKAHGFIWNSVVANRWAARLTVKEAQSLPFNVVKDIGSKKS